MMREGALTPLELYDQLMSHKHGSRTIIDVKN